MKNKICKISLFSAILACVANVPVDAAVKTKNSNRSYANAYNQVASMQQQQAYYDATATNATTASATANLPVMVDDKKLAEDILNNTSSTTSMAHLEACSMIYPNGVFKWGIPESGVRMNQVNQCVAVVELRDANTNAVLATTTVAAGDSMKCNADMFPQSGLMPAIEKVEVPNDNPPTLQDVERVMNEEQKQNAGFKIAAAAIIGGVAGNMLAPKNAGDNKIMGTGKTQLMDTAIGMTAGAGIMAASSYSGKVAGDTIKSTAVNAAAGMVVGNMTAGMGGGDVVLSIKKCNLPNNNDERDCVVGNLITKGDAIENGQRKKSNGEIEVYIMQITGNMGSTLLCKQAAENETDAQGNSIDLKDCRSVTNPLNIMFGDISYDSIVGKTDNKKRNDSLINAIAVKYKSVGEGKQRFKQTTSSVDPADYLLITSADLIGSSVHAYAVYETRIPTKAFGYTENDFNTDSLFQNPVIYARNNDGSVGRCLKNCSGKETAKENEESEKTENVQDDEDKLQFKPTNKDASDGGIIDINNEARAKATLIGTAAGGAMGGFAGYQGAKSEVEERWVEAVRTYNDSLSNFVCMTGGRFLAKYNDYVEIPTLKTEQ